MNIFYSNEELIEDLRSVANVLGRDTVPKSAYDLYGRYGYSTIDRRFGGWRNALLASGLKTFDYSRAEIVGNIRKGITKGVRYDIMKRDNFKCVICGRSPADDPKIVLHIDHIVPVAKGGLTEMKNLRTLCSDCNLGKGVKD